MSKGGGGNQTTTTKPFSRAQQNLQTEIAQLGRSILDQGPQQFFPGSTVAPFSDATEQGLSLLEQRGMQGNPAIQQGQQTLGGIQMTGGNQALQSAANGDFLNSNPFLDQTFNRGAKAIRENFQLATAPGIDARFANSGRVGSGVYARAVRGAQENLAEGLGDFATNLYGNNFARERALQQQAGQQLTQNQLQAAGLAPRLAESSRADLQGLLAAGSARDDLEAARREEEFQRFQFEQNAPITLANQLLPLGGAQGMVSQGPSATRRNPAAGFIGGAAGGAGIASALSLSNPLTAGLTIGGGILGLL